MVNCQAFLEKMVDWDKDQRFMAASDLCTEIVNSNTPLEQSIQKRVCLAFLKQLEDASIDVQGNAVKCIAKIVCKFQEAQVGDVLAKLSELILDPDKKEVRDIYATCLKGLVSEVQPALSTTVVTNVMPKMIKGITEGEPQMKEECCGVSVDVLKRFGDNQHWWTDGSQEKMCNSLLELVCSSEVRASLRKKAVVCIGSLSAVLADDVLDKLVGRLLEKFQQASDGANSEKQSVIQCVGLVGRHAGHRIGGHLNRLAPLLIDLCKKYCSEDVSMEGPTDLQNEVVEISLHALESFVLHCSAQLETFLPQIVELVSTLLSFDPNVYSVDGDDEEFDDDDGDFDDDGLAEDEDDDSSWKVRRGALRVLVALVRSYPGHAKDLFEKFVPQLVDRFREREETVQLDVFNSFSELVRASVLYSDAAMKGETEETVLGPRAPSRKERPAAASIVAVIPQVVTALLKQLKDDKNKRGVGKGKASVGALSILKNLALALPHQLEPHLPSLAPALVDAVKDSKGASAVRLDSLAIFHLLVSTYSDPSLHANLAPDVMPCMVDAAGDSYYKTSAMAIRLYGAFVWALRPNLSMGLQPGGPAYESLLISVLASLKVKLEAAEVDQEVKEAALLSFGDLTAALGDLPAFHDAISQCLPGFGDRLKNEATRRAGMTALKTICKSPNPIPLGPGIQSTFDHLAGLITLQSRGNRLVCLDVLGALVRKYGLSVPIQGLNVVLSQCYPYIDPGDLHLSDLSVRLINSALRAFRESGCPQEAQVVAETIRDKCLTAVLNVARSPVLQGHTLQSVRALFSLVGGLPQHFPYEQIFQALQDVECCASASSAHAVRETLNTLASCLAALVAALPDQNTQLQSMQHFKKQMETATQADLSPAQLHSAELAVLCLGESGRAVDLNSGVFQSLGVFDAIMSLLFCHHEELRAAAALALGHASVGSISSFLPLLVQRIHQGPAMGDKSASANRTHYLLLTSLREVISQHWQSNHGGVGRGVTDASMSSGDVDMTTGQAEGADGIAALLSQHVSKILPTLMEYAASEEDSERAVVAECLGQLLSVSPTELSQQLGTLFGSTDPKQRATAAVAVRYAAAKHDALELNETQGLLGPFLQSLADADLNVRRHALYGLHVLCLSSHCLRWQEVVKSQASAIVEQLWKDSQVKPELIREVDLGPFKHKVDDGLPLRKAAFQALSSLMRTFTEQVANQKVMDFVIAGLADHDDVQVLSCQLLSDLCGWNGHVVVAKLDSLCEPVDKSLARCLKQLGLKQDVDRVNEALRLLARMLKAVSIVAIAHGVASGPFVDLLAKFRKERTFAAHFDELTIKDFAHLQMVASSSAVH